MSIGVRSRRRSASSTNRWRVNLGRLFTSIAAAVEEQGTATREISANTQLAAEGTRVVLRSNAGVTSGAEAAGAAAQNVWAA